MEEKIFYDSSGIKVTNFIIESAEWTTPINEVKQVKSEPLGQYAVQGQLLVLAGFYFLFQFRLLPNPLFLDLWWWLGVLFVGLIFFSGGYFFINGLMG